MMTTDTTPHGSPWRSRHGRAYDASSLVCHLTADELDEILQWISDGGWTDVAAICAGYLERRR